MDLVNRFKALVLLIFSKIFHLLRRAARLAIVAAAAPPPPIVHHAAAPPPPVVHHAAAAPPYPVIHHAAVDENNPPPAPMVADQHNLDWAMIMIGFCLPSAVEIALQSLQTQSLKLPPMFHFLSLAIIFSFTFLFVGKFMSTNFPMIAQVLERVGVLFAVTAIFVAISIPLPLWLKCITWTLFATSFVAIIICIIYRPI